jgi:hypothetical protein
MLANTILTIESQTKDACLNGSRRIISFGSLRPQLLLSNNVFSYFSRKGITPSSGTQA